MGFEKIFVSEDTPGSMPNGAGAFVKTGATPTLYIQGENGEAVEHAAGETETTGTITAVAAWGSGTINYYKKGDYVHLSGILTATGAGSNGVATGIDAAIRPSSTRYPPCAFYDDSAGDTLPAILNISSLGDINTTYGVATDDVLYIECTYRL